MLKLLTASVFLFLFTTNGFAAVATVSGNCTKQSCIIGTAPDNSLQSNTYGCKTSSEICYYGGTSSGGTVSTTYSATYCTSCNTGYELKTYTSVSQSARGCTVTYDLCVPKCPSECPNDTSYSDAGNGKQVTCSKTVVPYQCSYRCANNYYGNGVTCSLCPGSGKSLAGNNRTITGCYVEAGYKGSNTAGDYEYTGRCYYSV